MRTDILVSTGFVLMKRCVEVVIDVIEAVGVTNV